MQRDFVIQQLKEEAQKVEKHLSQLQQDEPLTQAETEQFLYDVEKLYRNLAVYAHVLKTQGNLQVHLKIMQNAPLPEEPVAAEKMVQPPVPTPAQPVVAEQVEPAPVAVLEENTAFKKIEVSINDRFRIINELFAQSQSEFQAALQQLNSIHTLDESLFYLDSLKQIYKWKDDNQLVKTLYSLVNRRFS